MKTMKKALALVLGLCMLMSLASVSALAEETEYTPTYSYDRFFYGSSGEGFLKTKVDYDNDGETEDYYIAYGLNGYYTSIDGISWDKRFIVTDKNNITKDNNSIRSLAYGNNTGIAVLNKGNKTALLFDEALNSHPDSPANDGTLVSNAYNKLAGENTKWIELHPNIYFDEYSGLFFCHGFEYDTTATTTYTDIGLYYTDGTVSSETYGEKTVNALTWSEVEGDLFDGEGFSDKTKTYSELTQEKISIIGDDSGDIIVTYHGQVSSNTYSPNPKNYYSFIKTSLTKKTV